jgi:hypothetical protein
VQALADTNAGRVLTMYPVSKYGNASAAWSAMQGDATNLVPDRRPGQYFSKSTSVYQYEFNDLTAPQQFPTPAWFRSWPRTRPSCRCSSAWPAVSQLTDAQVTRSHEMQAYWTHYAIGSNPIAGRRAGINIHTHLIRVYVLSGFLRPWRPPGRRPHPLARCYQPISEANEIAGSQTGSQRRQTLDDARRLRAIISAASLLNTRRPATSRDRSVAPEKRKVGGSTPPLTTSLTSENAELLICSTAVC